MGRKLSATMHMVMIATFLSSVDVHAYPVVGDPCVMLKSCLPAGISCKDGAITYDRESYELEVAGFEWRKFGMDNLPFDKKLNVVLRTRGLRQPLEDVAQGILACLNRQFSAYSYRVTVSTKGSQGRGQSCARDFEKEGSGKSKPFEINGEVRKSLTAAQREAVEYAERTIAEQERLGHVLLGLARVFSTWDKTYADIKESLQKVFNRSDLLVDRDIQYLPHEQGEATDEPGRHRWARLTLQLRLIVHIDKATLKKIVVPPPPLLECSDKQDNDSDDLVDYPADPGCDSPEDDDERNCLFLTGDWSWGVGMAGLVTTVDDGVEAVPALAGDIEKPMRIKCSWLDLQWGLAVQAGAWKAKDTLLVGAATLRIRHWVTSAFGIGGEVGLAVFGLSPTDAEGQGGLGVLISPVLTIEGIKSRRWWLPLPPNVEIRPGVLLPIPGAGSGGGGYLGFSIYWDTRNVPVSHSKERR